MPLEKINRYRDRWGLDALATGGSEPKKLATATAVITGPRKKNGKPEKGGKRCGSCGGGSKRRFPGKPNGYGPGSKLMDALKKAGATACDECRALAAKMDQWGAAGCENRLEEIVEDILPRAKAWAREHRPVLSRLLSISGAFEDKLLKSRIRGKVRQAISEAKDKPPPSRRRSGPKRRGRKWKPDGNWLSAFKVAPGTPEYISTERLASDTLSLVSQLPPDITQVAAVSRSGLAPGTILSMALHLPMIVIRHHQGDWVPAGNGWRLLEGAPKQGGKTLVVDDTTMTGNSLKRTKHVIQDMPGEKVFAAVYVNPAAVAKPDIWAHDLPWPHLLEWNLFNSVLLDSFALDFDGILCRDCRPEDDDDGPRYRRFLQNTRPRYLVRKRPIKLIVTARLERYRPETLAWMDRWGIRAKELVMGPWSTAAMRRQDDVAAWKAQSLQEFLAKRGGVPPKFYIESDAKQAKRIAEITDRLVVCPPAGRCLGKAKR